MSDIAAGSIRASTAPGRSALGSTAPGLGPTLAIATLVQIVATAAVLALTALALEVAGDLGIGAHWIGYQISVIYASGVISSAIAGTLVQRFGPSRAEQVALFLFALGFLCLASGQIALMLAASLMIGFGYGLNNPASSQMLSRVTPDNKRNLVFSLKQSGVPLGGILASFAFPFLAAALGWQGALAIAAAVPFALMVILSVSHKDEASGLNRKAPFGRGFLDEQSLIWRNSRLATLSALGFLYSAMQLSMSAFAVVALVHDAGWSLLQAGSVAAAMQLAGAFGRVGWGVVADRIGGGFRTLGLLGLISALCCILLFWLPQYHPAVQVALFVAMGSVSIGWNGVLLAEIARNAPSGRVGAITGGVLVYTFIGVIVGPSSFAAIYGVTGHYGLSFLIFSAFGFIGMFAAWRVQGSKG